MRYRSWRVSVFLAACAPIPVWLWQLWSDVLGADPGKTLVDRLGLAALCLLLVTLAMTPMRNVSSWSGWIAVRRQLGLWSFTYAFLHVAGYLVFLLGLDFTRLLTEIYKRPYILVGGVAFVGLLMLAVTSNRFSVRRLGRRWKQLHKAVYGVLLLVLLHMLWVVRADMAEWSAYAFIGLALLATRLWRPRNQQSSVRVTLKSD